MVSKDVLLANVTRLKMASRSKLFGATLYKWDSGALPKLIPPCNKKWFFAQINVSFLDIHGHLFL